MTFGTGKWHNGEASWLRAFQRGRTVMFGGMSDHTKVPVRDLGADGRLLPPRTATNFSSELFADSAIDFLKGHSGPATVLRLRRLHRAARSTPTAARVPASVLRATAAAAPELPAAAPVRQRRDEGRARREPRRLAAHRDDGPRPTRRVLRHDHAPRCADPPRARGPRRDRTRRGHDRRLRGRQRPGDRQPWPARQAERLRAQHAGAADDRRPRDRRRPRGPRLHLPPRPLPDDPRPGGRGAGRHARRRVAAAGPRTARLVGARRC